MAELPRSAPVQHKTTLRPRDAIPAPPPGVALPTQLHPRVHESEFRTTSFQVDASSCRCVVVRLPLSPPSPWLIDDVLAGLPDASFVHSSSDPIGSDVDGVVFAASAEALPALLDHVAALRRTQRACAILVAGERFDADQLTSLLEAGADDFVAAPFNADEMAARLRRALGLLAGRARAGRDALGVGLRNFIGENPAFVKQVRKIPAIAACDAGVLILGETGTGKEVCAQAVHYLSARASRPWVAVNCGALPIDLVESELFGHVRGAYTTAHTSREGLVAEAEGGTLFLDDIDCLPLHAQTKLLRFLQEREYRMVGANAVRRADVRVIAACNRNLAELAARGAFRSDLYFRLNVLTLTLPPLRERRDDIPALAAHCVTELARKLDRRAFPLSPQALTKLLAHEWPGNVRELQHVVERALLLSTGPTLSAEDIDIGGVDAPRVDDASFRAAKARLIEQFERTYIEHLLATCAGNITHAAQEAKKNRRAFFALIRKHRIEPQRFRTAK
jgi:two-component system, NtrC family, response regulator GlrR